MHQIVQFARTLVPYCGAAWSWGEGCGLEDIYYYTPLPLNVANNNKQQAINKQGTLLLSVLAITSFYRFGLYCTLATSYPRWCPCQIQVLSKTAHFVPQNSLFLAQNGTEPPLKRPNEGKHLLHCTCALIAL